MRQQAIELLARASHVEPFITSTLSTIAEQANASLHGLEYRIKSIDSLERKLTSLIEEGMTSSEAVADIRDSLRYTLVLPLEGYMGTYTNAMSTLNSLGFTVVKVSNYWHSTSYKGINVAVAFGSQVLEIQFHTVESLTVKMEKSHPIYEQMRVCRVSEMVSLYASQLTALWASVTVPMGV